MARGNPRFRSHPPRLAPLRAEQSIEEQTGRGRHALLLEERPDATLSAHTSTDACGVEQVDGALLEHAGADSPLDVVACSCLEHDGLDPLQLEQPCEHEPGGPCAHDPHLRALYDVPLSNSAACPWPTPTHSVASP